MSEPSQPECEVASKRSGREKKGEVRNGETGREKRKCEAIKKKDRKYLSASVETGSLSNGMFLLPVSAVRRD